MPHFKNYTRGDDMYKSYKNLVFEGSGTLAIANLGVLQFLYEQNLAQNFVRVAGTSSGALSACLTAFNLPHYKIKEICDTLAYDKVLGKDEHPDLFDLRTKTRDDFEEVFDDIDCLYRLINNYGWYTNRYFYEWIQNVIAEQFDQSKKKGPYTFADFKNSDIHMNKTPFKDLYITGTNVYTMESEVFSYETTPNMEVALAINISTSVPVFFESVKYNNSKSKKPQNLYCDGCIMKKYPLDIFDSPKYTQELIGNVNFETIGVKFDNTSKLSPINNIFDYILNIFEIFMRNQSELFFKDDNNVKRSIIIATKNSYSLNFELTSNNSHYNYLYKQGYESAKAFFKNKTP